MTLWDFGFEAIKVIEGSNIKLLWFNVLAQGHNTVTKALVIFQYFSRQIIFSRTFQESPLYSSTFQASATPGIM